MSYADNMLAKMAAAIAAAREFPCEGSIGAAVKAVADARACVVKATRACVAEGRLNPREAFFVVEALHRDESLAAAEDAADELFIMAQ